MSSQNASSGSQVILSSEFVLSRYGESLAGKKILITGVANDSIAGELALQLSAAKPSLVILTARSESRVEPVVAKIKAKHPDVAVRFLKLDLASLADVRRAARELLDDGEVPKIDHLVAVAGVMVPPYQKTADGVELQFAVNYLANFLLVKELLPKVRAAGPKSSIVICASSAVRGGSVNFDDVNYSDGETYDPIGAYAQSNAARVVFARSLAEKLKGENIRVFSVDPGAVASGLQRNFTGEFLERVQEMRKSVGPVLRDYDGRPYDMPPFTGASEGASNLITAMTDPTIEDASGAYICRNAVADEQLTSWILNRENWVKLWELSEKLIGEPFAV
ncbi:putative short-chain oxidoreductase [Trichoderma citrinoviride]|uniref:Putative short-chain oxidoreductase n=1 Tax=Trichoderma citrinoviride TaxID=58853 RepID=A0A2T4B4F5_9HYPO|nr:putative short-chain oxidoreductase [Trichoderma citrinoviride]PTB64138.1 putative short-chain oxidoreductase [Trichoderma citrinoviride]